MQVTESMQKVQFINETFSPSEAKDVILKVIDDQINYYKLQDLSCWMKNNPSQQEVACDRIAQMKQKKEQLSEIIKEAEAVGQKVKLSCDFDILLTD